MIEVRLTAQQETALQHSAGLGSSHAIVNLEGHLDPSQPPTAESFLLAHINSIITHYVSVYEAGLMASVQSLGELLLKLPKADQNELIGSLVERANALGIDTSMIGGGGGQP